MGLSWQAQHQIGCALASSSRWTAGGRGGKKRPQPVVRGWGLQGISMARPSVASDDRDIICNKSVPRCEDEKIRILIFGAGCCGLHTAGERHALQKIDHVTIVQHNSVPLCPALHHEKRGCQSRPPRQLCQFRTFSCARTVYKSYSGTALPQKSKSRPPPPVRSGPPFPSIVAFPCMRTDYCREYCGLSQARHVELRFSALAIMNPKYA
jgi:hypothetical protein